MSAHPDEPEGASVVGVDPASQSVVLTYDDGPTRGVTDRLLTVLADAGATATFFVLLGRVRKDPSLLRDLLEAGHEVGLHGRDHRRLTTLDAGTVPALLQEARAELQDLASEPVRWFRPPYGAQDATTWRAARAAGLVPVLWGVHCSDWLDLPLDDRLAELRSGRLAGSLAGSIVLLHDGYADAGDGVDDGPAPSLDRVALTSAVLREVDAAGLKGRQLGAVVARWAPVVEPWFDAG